VWEAEIPERVVGKREAIQKRASRKLAGSVTTSRRTGSGRYCSRLVGNPNLPSLLRYDDCAVFTQSASVSPDYLHFLATETCVFDRYAEEQVFILLVVGGQPRVGKVLSLANLATVSDDDIRPH
jgi:hypothetical protein